MPHVNEGQIVLTEAQELPKGTIPLGGMVAQGPFPLEEWFPRSNFGAIFNFYESQTAPFELPLVPLSRPWRSQGVRVF